MAKSVTCYFRLSHGLQGCYLPDFISGPYAVSRRKDLTNAVRTELDMLGISKRRMREVKWKNVWHHAKRYGTSSLHFSFATGENTALSFIGLTEDEYKAAESEQGNY